jgi:hypothetical protein
MPVHSAEWPSLNEGRQNLRKRNSLALASTFSRAPRSGSIRTTSTAPAINEKNRKKGVSLLPNRRSGINENI